MSQNGGYLILDIQSRFSQNSIQFYFISIASITLEIVSRHFTEPRAWTPLGQASWQLWQNSLFTGRTSAQRGDPSAWGEGRRGGEERIRSKQIDEERIRSKQIDEERIRSKQVDEEPIRSKQIDEERIRSKQIDEERIRSKQVDEEPIRSKQIDKEPIRSKQIDEERIRSKQIDSYTYRRINHISTHVAYVPDTYMIPWNMAEIYRISGG